MPRTKTDDVLAASEIQYAHDPERAELIARVRRFKASWFELGEALTEIKRSEGYKKWGHAAFEDYCKKELHLKRETADKLTGSFVFLRAKAPEVLRRDGRDHRNESSHEQANENKGREYEFALHVVDSLLKWCCIGEALGKRQAMGWETRRRRDRPQA